MKLKRWRMHLHRSPSKSRLRMYATAVPFVDISMRAISQKKAMITNVQSVQFQRICLKKYNVYLSAIPVH